ncbi:hypothetical protein SAMN06265222_103381 [Neorhodopirellula lusitana]|uniref:Secreted protein n=1 Tax=Neorhodopirellula lusitana TaxID=445327 RepID=A0ABY1PXF9_9BACT|nr:hypothetical protein SAMN06265222_103381 [Neorhodopirellula lusitana]
MFFQGTPARRRRLAAQLCAATIVASAPFATATWNPTAHADHPTSFADISDRDTPNGNVTATEPSTRTWNRSTTWQPRPLSLPATSDRDRWSPPAPVVPQVSQVVIQTPPPAPIVRPPEPAPTPAEIRQQRLAFQRAETRVARELSQQWTNNEPLPPSDQIDIGSRKSQLAATAVEQLRLANWSAKRGAIASAQAAATQTLRTIALLRDTQAGGNLHTQQLNECFVAIRESTDFAGRYGPVDTDAIKRLIEVHQTPTLKQVSTSQLTASRAVEAYLQFAKTRLVEATQGGPLAAEAAMILADVESWVADGAVEPPTEHSKLHASALALTYRRAAVEIAPENPDAAAKLGRTLLRRSIPTAAKDYLLQSVNAEPTRQRVESLLEAAARSGDFILVDQCEKQLAATPLPSELPIQMMSPQDFARTSQTAFTPGFASTPAGTTHNGFSPTPQSPASQSPTPQYRVGTRPAYRTAAPRSSTPLGARTDQIVDPTLPTSPAANRSNGRLLW